MAEEPRGWYDVDKPGEQAILVHGKGRWRSNVEAIQTRPGKLLRARAETRGTCAPEPAAIASGELE